MIWPDTFRSRTTGWSPSQSPPPPPSLPPPLSSEFVPSPPPDAPYTAVGAPSGQTNPLVGTLSPVAPPTVSGMSTISKSSSSPPSPPSPLSSSSPPPSASSSSSSSSSSTSCKKIMSPCLTPISSNVCSSEVALSLPAWSKVSWPCSSTAIPCFSAIFRRVPASVSPPSDVMRQVPATWRTSIAAVLKAHSLASCLVWSPSAAPGHSMSRSTRYCGSAFTNEEPAQAH
mmetsp:Transcript_18922/g.49660  ORF Transcript_18922/g.49660 Transcript_18922/m.49660 type:complete len:228 (+) Transcript_18922:369-1052(+)